MIASVSPMAPGVEPLDLDWVRRTVRTTLDEDLGGFPGRDVTSQATISPSKQVTAHLMARQNGVVAGLAVAPEALAQVAERFGMTNADGPATSVVFDVPDGTRVRAGDRLAVLTAPVQAILIAERTLLNLASRASGVATATRVFADQLEGTSAMVLDTRKTTPGLRELEKYAVRAGGGTNKRMGLYDVAMVKDNHVVAAGSVSAAIEAVRAQFPEVLIQVEADTYAQAIEAVDAGARFLLLDNMSNDEMRAVVETLRPREADLGKIELEATGTVTVPRAAGIAATGVDYMSVGALTHSAPILDLALDLVSR
ncbi:carboxylating nicotinate-nucleotide diphosphorylase [Populibacterium corticicola]|uniref:nicotinate-nucleotide diphosphorylase (carboxylating) n=1 Tax=Populibacterium corticicola TaxID=1812826 RepID=A0ABW5XG83_9MICO